jgi:hypothetical protein
MHRLELGGCAHRGTAARADVPSSAATPACGRAALGDITAASPPASWCSPSKIIRM